MCQEMNLKSQLCCYSWMKQSRRYLCLGECGEQLDQSQRLVVVEPNHTHGAGAGVDQPHNGTNHTPANYH